MPRLWCVWMRRRSEDSRWSEARGVFWRADKARLPGLSLDSGRLAVAVYHGLAYSRGPIGRLVDRVAPRGDA